MTKILLIEDNELNRDMLSRRLQKRGYEIVMAVDGERGVGQGAERSAGPDPDGHEPARDRRLGGDAAAEGSPATRHIPIIALTAHAMAGDRDKALAAGCDDFDTKPIELPRLLQKIATLLKQG